MVLSWSFLLCIRPYQEPRTIGLALGKVVNRSDATANGHWAATTTSTTTGTTTATRRSPLPRLGLGRHLLLIIFQVIEAYAYAYAYAYAGDHTYAGDHAYRNRMLHRRWSVVPRGLLIRQLPVTSSYHTPTRITPSRYAGPDGSFLPEAHVRYSISSPPSPYLSLSLPFSRLVSSRLVSSFSLSTFVFYPLHWKTIPHIYCTGFTSLHIKIGICAISSFLPSSIQNGLNWDPYCVRGVIRYTCFRAAKASCVSSPPYFTSSNLLLTDTSKNRWHPDSKCNTIQCLYKIPVFVN